jgi:hypothetical protein
MAAQAASLRAIAVCRAWPAIRLASKANANTLPQGLDLLLRAADGRTEWPIPGSSY